MSLINGFPRQLTCALETVEKLLIKIFQRNLSMEPDRSWFGQQKADWNMAQPYINQYAVSKAAEVTGLAQPDISRIKNADLKGFTLDRLVTVLNRLNRQVEVRVIPVARTDIPPTLPAKPGAAPFPMA